jgi:hypothetical protein
MRSILTLALVLAQARAPIVKPLENPKPQSSGTQANAKRSAEKPPVVGPLQTPEERLATYTLVLTAFTGVLMLAAFYQGWQLRKTVKQMSASEERQLRAYITMMSEVADPYRPNQPGWNRTDGEHGFVYELWPKFRNDGQTPAYDVRGVGRVAVFPVPPPDDCDLSLPEELPVLTGVLGAGQPRSMQLVSPELNGEEIVAIGSDQGKRLFIFGLITYRDIFGNSHQIRFFDGIQFASGGVIVYATGRHNEGD